MSFVNIDLTPEKIKKILQHINDQAHNALDNGEVIILAKHDRKDPRRIEVIADSIYDQQLEGQTFLFEDKQAFKTIFPMFAQPPKVNLPPNTVQNEQGKPVAEHRDPYIPINASANAKAQDSRFDATNVYDGNPDSIWALNELGAEHYTDMGKIVDVGAIWIKWYRGHERHYKFSIGYMTDELSQPTLIPHLTNVMSAGPDMGKGDESAGDYEVYNLDANGKTVPLRYIYIRINGNDSPNVEEQHLAAIHNIQITKASAVIPTKVLSDNVGGQTI